MKFKQFVVPIVIFLIGLAATYIGALLKIIHFEIGFLTGNILITIATFLKVIAVVYTIIILVVFYFRE
ncbi:hypothetical protein DIS18_14475 [Algibacter marinivivus]|uniref:Uncharacterized protein n=1 Tax=Algibacter marinivivus TaxID=2100723 RepID=A0A2U2X156_9FLAO|nr:hypothetical protein [Algibacter marinivivus]PWH81484.1 hypothetical protein DIS18_14475 [Algibacter marinivivus]